jgi:hypothetical protein
MIIRIAEWFSARPHMSSLYSVEAADTLLPSYTARLQA